MWLLVLITALFVATLVVEVFDGDPYA